MDVPARKSHLATPAKLTALSAALLLLGVGLCSAGGFNLEGSDTVTTQIGILAFFGGIAGCGMGILWLLIAVVSNSGSPPAPPPKLPPDGQ